MCWVESRDIRVNNGEVVMNVSRKGEGLVRRRWQSWKPFFCM